jgi:lycopene beta-cyclase
VRVDVVLVGGGLANGVLALKLVTERPGIRLLLVEQGASLGGNHTWCFHATNVAPDVWRWLTPLVATSWRGHRVYFSSHVRELCGGYHAISSAHFHEVLTARLGDAVRLNTSAREVSARGVVLEGGEQVAARFVVDGRGFARRTRSR